MLHYYGDLVRRLFFAGGFIMLITLPYFRNLIPIPVIVSLLIAVGLTLMAGFTNPVSKPIAWLNLVVAICAAVLLEYYAVQALSMPVWDLRVQSFFWASHVLALDFIIALYYSAKTLRGMML